MLLRQFSKHLALFVFGNYFMHIALVYAQAITEEFEDGSRTNSIRHKSGDKKSSESSHSRGNPTQGKLKLHSPYDYPLTKSSINHPTFTESKKQRGINARSIPSPIERDESRSMFFKDINNNNKVPRSNKYQMESSDFVGPLVVNSDGSIASFNGPTLYSAHHQGLEPVGQDQMLANFYVSDGIQPTWTPQLPIDPTANHFGLHSYSRPTEVGKQEQTVNVGQQKDSHYTRRPVNLVRERPTSKPRVFKKKPPPPPVDIRTSRRRLPDMRASRPIPRKLSNDQLISLIDELKSYNQRQASKVRESDRILPHRASSYRAQNDYSKNRKQSSNNGRRGTVAKQDSKGKEPKLSAEELEKFAKFLMSKEGSNLKFQLGLDKDAPDDGDHDEDDKDTLLELNKRIDQSDPESRPNRGQPEDMDKKHEEVASHIDKLIDTLSKTTKKVIKAKNNKDEYEKENPDDEEPDESRRRTYDNESSPERITERKGISIELGTRGLPNANKKDDENFAKMLIKQELLEDQLETKNRATQSPDAEEAADDQAEPMRSSSGSHQNLIRSLTKARNDKSGLRSNLKPDQVEDPVRSALLGALEVQTSNHPNGTLRLANKGKPDVSLILMKNLKDDDSESLRDSELRPKQLDPDTDINGHRNKNEYQVSPKVEEHLKKLSNGLDNYFNDGFLKQIDEKSSYNGKFKGGKRDKDQYKPESTSNVEKGRSEVGRGERQSDQDFDVNVGIDGKRDKETPEVDNEDDGDDEVVKPRSKKRRHKPLRRKPLISDPSLKKNHNQTEQSKETKEERTQILEDSIVEKPSMQSDPVENETLETPIGPDSATQELGRAQGRKKITRLKETSSSAKGKKFSGKFYEEPEW